jgi:hypothetical protein
MHLHLVRPRTLLTVSRKTSSALLVPEEVTSLGMEEEAGYSCTFGQCSFSLDFKDSYQIAHLHDLCYSST